MVVINYQEQLQPGTFEYMVHYLIKHNLDLAAFHSKYRNDNISSTAYDPAIFLKIFLFADNLLRCKKKVQGQWQLYCLVHNIEKLANYGRTAA